MEMDLSEFSFLSQIYYTYLKIKRVVIETTGVCDIKMLHNITHYDVIIYSAIVYIVHSHSFIEVSSNSSSDLNS